ncbi:MAG TPA: hypothetical protein VNW95_12165 [Mucilaginibacter sp.]|jgi:hypothetical protein|nr:hypothetical protein [Mucilaginibacter sp.]
MRRYTFLFMLANVICIIACKTSIAQTAPVDSSSQQHAFNNAVILYNTSIGEQSPLYNGPEYFFYDPTTKGNAYFMDVNAFTPGSVYYDGVYYTGVPMLYDLYSDEVAVLLYNHFSKYSLIKYRVKSFDFLDHHFVNIDVDTLSGGSSIKSGYYDELYNGKTEVLVKRSKSVQTNTGGVTASERYYSPSRDFYIRKNKVYYSVSSQGSLLDIFKDKKKELQQYVKANEIRFRRDPEDAMVKVATYYDHLTN